MLYKIKSKTKIPYLEICEVLLRQNNNNSYFNNNNNNKVE